MVEIEFGRYRLRSDFDNWIIERRHKNSRTGEVRWRDQRYYPTLDSALASLLDSELCAADARDVAGLLTAHRNTRSLLATMLSSLKEALADSANGRQGPLHRRGGPNEAGGIPEVG